MNRLGKIFRTLLIAGYLLACGALASMAIIALFGFINPAMDLFNHVQPILFFGLLLLVVFSPLFLPAPMLRSLGLSLAATGFVASALIYLPEAVQGFAPRAPLSDRQATTYSLMTFNVFGRNEAPMSLVANITSVDPDIVALQEYSPYVRRSIHTSLVVHYPHFQYCAGGQRAFVGLYSKIPFEPLTEDTCSASAISTDRTARVIVRMLPENGAPFSVATTHNDWPAPVTRQVEQFNTLRDALATVNPPLILVGDFNSTPWSYTLRNFVSQSDLVRHTFNLPTFPKLWYYLRDWRSTPAILPIDHVMTRGNIGMHSLVTGDPSGSDHLPIIVEFSVGE